MNTMKTKLNRATIAILAATGILLANTTQAEIVYQNTTGDLSTLLNPGSFEVGDEILLAYGGGVITNFTFQYTASFSGDRLARVRFYENNGPLVSGFASPGSNFFDSGIFSIGSGSQTLTFDTDFGSGLAAPDHFTWSVQFFLVDSGDSAGLDLFNPVTVGNNFDDYWDNNGSVWTLRQSTNGIPINFAAQVEVIPEPSTVALGIFGCVLAWGISRRKR